MTMNNNDLKTISELLDKKLNPIQSELKRHGKALENQGKILTKHTKILKTLKKDQDVMLDMLDGEQMKQAKQLKRIEEHLNINASIS